MNSFRCISATAALLVTLGLAASASADVPRLISFQGKLAGQTTGPVDLDVRLSDAPTLGILYFSETHTDVPLNNGVFSIMIGSETPGGVPDLPLDVDTMYVSVSVDGAPELTPRTRIGMVPYAAKSNKSEVLVVPGTFDAVAMVDTSGNIDVAEHLNFALQAAPLITAGHNNTIPTRMWIAHSESFPEWGIQYRDYASDGYGSDAVEIVGGETDVPRFSFEAFTGDMIMTNPNGDQNIELRSRWSSSDTAAWMALRDGGSNRVVLDAANSGDDGQIELYNAGNTLQVLLDGEGEFYLRNNAGVDVLTMRGQDSLNTGGEIRMTDAAGDLTIDIDSDGGSGGYIAALGDTGNSSSAVMQATASGGLIQLRNSDGVTTITLDAETGGDGRITTQELAITGGSDLSEQFDIRGANVAPGLVVCIDPANPGDLVVSTRANDRTVAGIISGAGNVKPGMIMGQRGTVADGQHPVALTGRVWVQCDTGNGAIVPGDLLTTSAVPGHAMKVTDHAAAQGAIIGKAMTSLDAETGLVLVLVSLQ
jgi:hypothetical protein